MEGKKSKQKIKRGASDQDHQINIQPLATPKTQERTNEARPKQVNVARKEEPTQGILHLWHYGHQIYPFAHKYTSIVLHSS